MRKRVISFLLAFTVLLVFQAVPVYAAADDNSPQTVCTADILIDADSGQVLYEKNQDRLLQPASLTKMMTCRKCCTGDSREPKPGIRDFPVCRMRF